MFFLISQLKNEIAPLFPTSGKKRFWSPLGKILLTSPNTSGNDPFGVTWGGACVVLTIFHAASFEKKGVKRVTCCPPNERPLSVGCEVKTCGWLIFKSWPKVQRDANTVNDNRVSYVTHFAQK